MHACYCYLVARAEPHFISWRIRFSTHDSDEDALSKWTSFEQENRSKEKKIRFEEELNPKPYLLHRCFQLIKTITIVSAICMAFGQLVGVAVEIVTPTQYVLRVYVMLLCALTVLNELEWTRYATDSTLLRLWITRGLFYAFVGVLGLEENASTPKRVGVSTLLLLYVRVVAWLMVACGLVYTVLGCACFQLVEEHLRKDLERRKERAAEIERTATLYRDEVGAMVL